MNREIKFRTWDIRTKKWYHIDGASKFELFNKGVILSSFNAG